MLAFNPPPIFGLGTAGGFEFYIQNRGDGGPQAPRRGDAAVPRRARNSDPQLGGVQTLWRADVPQLYVDVDREKAKALGVPIDDVFDTLAATLGTYYVNDFNKYGRTWQVLMSAEPRVPQAARRHRRRLRALDKGRDDPAVVARARCSYTSGPDSLDRFNNLPAVKIIGQARAGRAARARRSRASSRSRSEVLPPDFSFDWGGASFQEKTLRRHLDASRSASRRSWCS